jgi:hypothetical protein
LSLVFLEFFAATSIGLSPDADRPSGATELCPTFFVDRDFTTMPTQEVGPFFACMLLSNIEVLETGDNKIMSVGVWNTAGYMRTLRPHYTSQLRIHRDVHRQFGPS